jgi:MFS family permease
MPEPAQEVSKQKKIMGLPQNIFFLGLTSLFNDFSSEMVFAVFPAFFTSVLKAGAASLGLVDGIAEGCSNIFKIYSGSLSDKFQKRKALVVFGYAFSVLSRPFYSLTSTVLGALGLRVMDRSGKGFRDAPRDAIISLSTPKEELGRAFGYHRMMDTLGSILGPLVAYLILRSWPLNFNAVFLTSFVIGIIAVFSLVFISDIALRISSQRAQIAGSLRRLSPQFRIFMVSVFILSVGSLPVAVVLLKTTSIGLVIADIPLFYMIYNLSYAAFSIPAGKLSDKVGAKAVIFIGYFILLISYFFLAQAHSVWPLIIGFLIFGLCPALTDGVQRSLAAQLSAEELRGGALGLLNASVGLGALVAGVVGGYLWQAQGSSLAFAAGGTFVIIGLALLLVTRQTAKV